MVSVIVLFSLVHKGKTDEQGEKSGVQLSLRGNLKGTLPGASYHTVIDFFCLLHTVQACLALIFVFIALVTNDHKVRL